MMSIPKLPKVLRWRVRYYSEGIVLGTETLKAKTEHGARKEAQESPPRNCDAIEIKPNIRGIEWRSVWA